MYTLREFRANTKQAFDDADAGHEVVIKRGKQMFQLISLVSNPLKSSFESMPGKSAVRQAGGGPTLPEATKAKQNAVSAVGQAKLCKHGFPPAFCKHAKPGKPCR